MNTVGLARVLGPDGTILTAANLPPAGSVRRWTIRRKAEVVAAVDGGLLSLEDARTRYLLSAVEFMSWKRATERHGLAGLRTTAPESYPMKKPSIAVATHPEPPAGEVDWPARALAAEAKLDRIAENATWRPYPGEHSHVLYDLLVVGSVQRFSDDAPCYASALGMRIGAMTTDEGARKAVVGEVTAGTVSAQMAVIAAAIEERVATGITLEVRPPATGRTLDQLGITCPRLVWDAASGCHVYSGCKGVPAELPEGVVRRSHGSA